MVAFIEKIANANEKTSSKITISYVYSEYFFKEMQNVLLGFADLIVNRKFHCRYRFNDSLNSYKK